MKRCQYVKGLFGSHLGSVSLRNIYCLSFGKLLPENPTNNDDSRNTKEIQASGVLFFLKLIESAWFVRFSDKSLLVLNIQEYP